MNVSYEAWSIGVAIVLGVPVLVFGAMVAWHELELRDRMQHLAAGAFVIAGLAGLAWLIGAALTWAGVVA